MVVGWPWLPDLMRMLTGLTAAGFLTIAASGVLASALGAAAGKEFVAGDRPGVVYTAERCANFLEAQPRAADCETAVLLDRYEEVVLYRILGGGVFGLASLAVYLLLSRRWRQRSLPTIVGPTAGAAASGIAALTLGGSGVASLLIEDSAGSGAFLSAGIAAGVAFLIYAWVFGRCLVRKDLP
jgi:hypothetical protein